MRKLDFIFFSFILISTFITMLLFVLFGQMTVRRLRKNPETKHDLGVELVSGWDIINVAQALFIPRSIIKKFKGSKLSLLYADADLLYKHTNKYDRFLGRLFYGMLMISGLSGALLGLLNVFGVLG